MKKLSEHLGEVIVALACAALLISVLTLFHSPIEDFFSSVTADVGSIKTSVVDSFEGEPDDEEIGGEFGDVGGGPGHGSGGYGEVPANVTDFYTYTLNDDSTGYELGLKSEFKTVLNANSDYVVVGETLWEFGTPLPNPGSTYDGLPVTSMNGMFAFCTATELDLSKYDTSNVTDMSVMFSQCTAIRKLDLSSFDTSMVTKMDGMFQYCSSLTSLDLSSFDTSNATDMSFMFFCSIDLTSIVARTEADKTKFEGSEGFPSGCEVWVEITSGSDHVDGGLSG